MLISLYLCCQGLISAGNIIILSDSQSLPNILISPDHLVDTRITTAKCQSCKNMGPKMTHHFGCRCPCTSLPHNARASAGTWLTIKSNIFSVKFLWLKVILSYLIWPDDTYLCLTNFIFYIQVLSHVNALLWEFNCRVSIRFHVLYNFCRLNQCHHGMQEGATGGDLALLHVPLSRHVIPKQRHKNNVQQQSL